MNIPVTSIQRFSIHDGPGVRTTVFLKGCPLKCKWCHNPETQDFNQELLFYQSKCILCGNCADACTSGVHTIENIHQINRSKCNFCKRCIDACPVGALEFAQSMISVERIIEIVSRDIPFYGELGGITLSGGEPMAHPLEAIEILSQCKKNNISTAIETSGYFNDSFIKPLIDVTDLFLYDIKDTNDERHFNNTGVHNDIIISNLKRIDSLDGKTKVRCILINGVNTFQEHYENIASLVSGLHHCQGIEIIPYHCYGISKYDALERCTHFGTDNVPSDDEIEIAKQVFISHGINVISNK